MKPITEIIVMDADTVEHRDELEETIGSLDYPLSEEARSHVGDLIEAEVQLVEQAVKRRKREEQERARGDLRQAEKQSAAHASELSSAEGQLAGCPDGSWVLAMVLTPFFLACLGMEFILSWATLTLLLGVEPFSVLGIMLGLGPTSAVAVLKIVIARLFEEPYQHLRMPMGTSRMHRVAVLGVMVLFLVAVGVFNVYTVVLLADVREDVSTAARDLRAATAVQPYHPIDSREAIVAVSVAAALDGAIFFLVAWNEGRNWRRRTKLGKAVGRAKTQAQELEVAVTRAESTLAARLQEDIEQAARAAGGRRRAQLQVALDREESRQMQARTNIAATRRQLCLAN